MKLLHGLLLISLFLSTEVFAAKKRRVGQINKEETNIMTNRVESRTFDFFSFGPTWFYSLDRDIDESASFQLGAGKLWDVTPHAAVKFRGDLAIHPDFNLFLAGIGLGANYYFNATDFSPFLSADLGMGYFYNDQNLNSIQSRDPDAGFGFQMGVSGGVILFRTSTTHLLVEPNIQWQMRGSYPMTVGLKLSIANSELFSALN